ncbi:MAG: haloacid dehalogenase [Ignavibacteriota bacterium]|jgi:phosphoglycolate phosphatase|nr:MAG: haloacid dehalogenase [Ignavibacteriota bacterium]
MGFTKYNLKTNVLFNKYDSIIFDLDDTIYPEIEYLKLAYKYVACQICLVEKLHFNLSDEIQNYLIETFIKNGRLGLFQKLINNFNLKRISIEEMVSFLHSVPLKENSIKVFPQIRSLITNHLNKKQKIILTNGNPYQQINKFYALDIPCKNDFKLFFASKSGKALEKPNPFYAEKIIKEFSLDKSKVIYIGDSFIDFITAKNANIKFLDVSFILHNESK